jgi:serine/threonine protein kinase
MPLSSERWKVIAESRYPWEREALEFVRQRLPDHDPYRAWANFEFIAEDGSINEVDLLVLTPKGFFLVEIKSRPGVVEGDAGTWRWQGPDGRWHSADNLLLLANRKAKKLINLLKHQNAVKKIRVPYLDARVFLSAGDLVCKLPDFLLDKVHLRDRESRPGQRARPGIVAALTRWSPGAPDDPGNRRVDRPIARALSRALGELGIRPSQRSRRVGDYVLQELITDGPAWQDWSAEHAAAKGVRARVRLYPVGRGSGDEARETNRRAAEREFRILQGVNHPGILRAEGFTMHERGAALIFEHDPKAVRLDHFLRDRGERLDLDTRLGLLRQIAEAVRYAHEKKLVHRTLSPQSILVSDPGAPVPRIRIFNWQTGARDGGSTSSRASVSGTLHPEQLVEGASLVYIAPEVIAGTPAAGEYADVFSLGAIAFHLFSGSPPAASLLQRDERLRSGRGLDLAAVLDGAGRAMRELVRYGTCPEVADRIENVPAFLSDLEDVLNEITTPDEEAVQDPTEAKANDRLPGGFLVKKRLGRGSCAVTFLVERDGVESVLKLAASSELNDRVREEAEVLSKLRHQHVVEFRGTVEIAGRIGILMARAGEQTLAQRLRDEGRIHVELLQRFGEDLLESVDWLEQQGIVHRDIKPDNIGVTPMGKRLHLVLFDFSLSRTPAENIRAGTRPYLDPFLSLRRPPRWDHYAERFAAAMTLYEMATGTLPRWGDGQSDPAMLEEEATLDTELFDTHVRERLAEFFRRALRRDYGQRFDTCEDMLRGWRRVFETEARPSPREEEAHADELKRALGEAELDTALALLPLSGRVVSAIERLGAVTVKDLMGVPVMRIYGMRGVGNKTRRELRLILAELARRLPLVEPKPEPATAEAAESYATERPSLDIVFARLLPARGRGAESEERVLRLFLGLNPDLISQTEIPPLEKGGQGGFPAWPSQTNVAAACGLTRARVSQVVNKARERWAKNPALSALRDEVDILLDANGGVMTAGELARAILSSRGSMRSEPERTVIALAVSRAVAEAERERSESRFFVQRRGDRVFITRRFELADYAERLGATADALAATDPLPSPARVREELAAIRAPEGVTLEPGRLIHLASAASHGAAVSSRLELYARGMSAARALRLAQGALLGAQELSAEEIQSRIASRYPEAEALPRRPVLDELIRESGWNAAWSAQAGRGRGAYVMPHVGGAGSVSTTPSSIGRYTTGTLSGEVTPEMADAQRFEERLRHALRHGAFLALTVRPHELRRAERELSRRFAVEKLSLEQLLLREMRAAAEAARVDWNVVLAADAAPAESRDWKNLMILARRALQKVKEGLSQADGTLLLTYPGLLARYDALRLLDHLRDRVHQPNGLKGVWLLIPSDDQQTMPMIDDKPVPVITPGQWARIPDAWLQNLHRANGLRA